MSSIKFKCTENTNNIFLIDSIDGVSIYSTIPSNNSTTASLIIYGGLGINHTNNATSLSSGGALTSLGGLSILKDVFIGGETYFKNTTLSTSYSDGAIHIDGGLTISCAENSTAIGNGGALTIQGGTSIGGDLYIGGQINGSGSSSSTFAYLTLTATDEAINLTSGALVTFGGITIQCTTNSSSSTDGGSLLVGGGASIVGDLYIGGNLNVSGIQTSIVSETLNVGDNLIVINSGPSITKDGGILIERFQIDNDTGSGDVVNDSLAFSTNIVSSTINTSIFNTEASNSDDYYNNWFIKITSGLGLNQVRKITDYIGSTRQATFNSSWTIQPTSGDTLSFFNRLYAGQFYKDSSDKFVFGFTANDPNSSSVNISEFCDVQLGNLIVSNTSNSIGLGSGGSITINGGCSISKNLYAYNITSTNTNTIGNIITTGGNVGINNTNPNYIIDIFNNSVVGNQQRIYNSHTSGGRAGILLQNGNTNGGFSLQHNSTNCLLESLDTAGNILLYNYGSFIINDKNNGNVERFRIVSSSGNVGINNNNPLVALDVIGSGIFSVGITSANVASTTISSSNLNVVNITSSNNVFTNITSSNNNFTNITCAKFYSTYNTNTNIYSTNITSTNIYSTNNTFNKVYSTYNTNTNVFSTNITSTNIYSTNNTHTNIFSTNNTLNNILSNSITTGTLSTTSISTGNLSSNYITSGQMLSNNITTNNLFTNTSITASYNSHTLSNIITTNGNIGINNTSPNYTIHLTGTQYIDNSQSIANTNPSTVSGGSLNIVGDLILGSSIVVKTGNVDPPSFTTRSIGTKINLYPELSASSVDFAIGNEAGNTWFSSPTFSSSGFKWYQGINNTMSLSSFGLLSIKSTTNSSGVGTGGALTILGGASITKDLYIGGNLYVNGQSTSFSGNTTIGSYAGTGVLTNTIIIGQTMGNTSYKLIGNLTTTSDNNAVFGNSFKNLTTTSFDVNIYRIENLGSGWTDTNLMLSWQITP